MDTRDLSDKELAFVHGYLTAKDWADEPSQEHWDEAVAALKHVLEEASRD